MKGRSTTVFSVRMPDELLQQLEHYRRFKHAWSRNEAIQRAVMMLLGIKWPEQRNKDQP